MADPFMEGSLLCTRRPKKARRRPRGSLTRLPDTDADDPPDQRGTSVPFVLVLPEMPVVPVVITELAALEVFAPLVPTRLSVAINHGRRRDVHRQRCDIHRRRYAEIDENIDARESGGRRREQA